ncbi:Wd-40 repeat protein [Mycena sanguinolenta]|uniref:Wd-40 repeat protein n=1 Tax=Mycena sanguinolenta TaxID=230812 RepID=A0A8H6Y015_9AGAR|nr:Wd-40 repeat protein [Mycena sanguinolenta]
MACLSSTDFIPRWQHSLSADFQQNGVPAGSEPWVTEVTKFAVGGETRVVVLSADGTTLAAGVGTEVHVYDTATSQLLHTLRDHAGFTVDNLEFHPRGRRLAASYTRNSPPAPLKSLVQVWDLDAAPDLRDEDDLAGAAKEVLTAASQSAVLSGTLPSFGARVFSHDGRSLLYRPDRKTVTVVDAATLTERFQLSGHTDAIMWAETSPNDKVVATSSWDRTVRIWSMESGESLRVLSRADSQSWAGAFSPDGDLIAAGAGDGAVRIWGVDTGQLLFTFSGFGGWVRSLAFSPDGLQLAAGSESGSLRIIDLKSWECAQSWQIDVNETGPALAGPVLEIFGVQYTLRGDLFFCASDGHMVGYRPSQNLKWDFNRSSVAKGVWFKTFAISKDGSKLVSSLGSNVGIWKID